VTIAIFPADSLTYAAKADRIANALELPGATSARPLGSMSGVRVGTPTDTVSVAGSTVTIKTHVGVIDKHTGADSGPFRYAVTANETLTLTAPHATLPRIDLITLRVDAPELSDGTGAPAVVAVRTTGTAAGSPVAPAPATTRELTLATVLVPQSGGGSAVVTWSAPYVPAAGGIIPVRNTTERDALQTAYPGTTDAPLIAWRKDAAKLELNSGSGWKPLGGGAYNYVWANAAARAAETGMIAGEKGYQTDTGIEYLRTASAWVANPTVCALRKSTTQNLTTSATALSWDVEISDNSGMHDNVTNNTRITATRAGLYEFLVSLYNSNTSGMGTVYGRLNGTTDIPGSLDRDTADATAALPLRTTFPIALVAGDYVEIMVLHATAAGNIAGGTAQGAAVVTAKWIGPA